MSASGPDDYAALAAQLPPATAADAPTRLAAYALLRSALEHARAVDPSTTTAIADQLDATARDSSDPAIAAAASAARAAAELARTPNERTREQLGLRMRVLRTLASTPPVER